MVCLLASFKGFPKTLEKRHFFLALCYLPIAGEKGSRGRGLGGGLGGGLLSDSALRARTLGCAGAAEKDVAGSGAHWQVGLST